MEMTRKETVKNLLTELIEMIDTGSQRDLDRADEMGKSIINLFEQESTNKTALGTNLIDREMAIEGAWNTELAGLDNIKIVNMLKSLPPATPEEPTESSGLMTVDAFVERKMNRTLDKILKRYLITVKLKHGHRNQDRIDRINRRK